MSIKMRNGIIPVLGWVAGVAVAAAQGISMPAAGEGMGPSPYQQHSLKEPLPGVPPSMLQAPPGSGGNDTARGAEGNLTILQAPGTLNYGPGYGPAGGQPGGAGNLAAPVTPGNSGMIPGLMTGNDTAASPPVAGAGSGFASSAIAVGSGSGTGTGAAGATPPEVVMPVSMEALDNVHKLATGDRLYYQVKEDRDMPRVLMVDEKGNIDVPYFGREPVAGKTLQEMAMLVKKDLEKNLYYNATVLAAPYTADRARQQVWVMGSVGRAGPVNIPADDVLTLWNAIWAAGGLTLQADATRVTLMRHDATGGNSTAKMEVNVQKIYETGQGDVVMQPGDFIIVPQKGEASGFVTITGAVRSPGIMPLPVGSNITVEQAILQAGGFSEWGDDEVKLVHYDDKGKRVDKWVEVGEVLRGDRSKDVPVQAGDLIIVYQKWINW